MEARSGICRTSKARGRDGMLSVLSEDANCNCDRDIMHCRKRKQVSHSYSRSMCNLCKTRADSEAPLPFTKKVGLQWKNHFWNTFIYPLVVLLFCTALCSADTNQCAIGITTPGRTWPQGDIVLEYGKPLKILCMLNQTYVDSKLPGKDSSDLVFFQNGKKIGPEFITVINKTTISLDINKPSPAKDMYYCKLRLRNGNNTKYTLVCLNAVAVGFKPQAPQNFSCVSNNWENLMCSWDPVENYVKTTFTLVYKLPLRIAGGKLYPCPMENQNTLPPNTCLWDASTNPIYRQPYNHYTFILYAQNVLGNASFTYKFNHFAHIIPAKPANLIVVNKTCDSALLYWIVPFPMPNFPYGLHHRIAYQNKWDRQKTWQVINITNYTHMHKHIYYNLTGLKYANTVYNVRVFMKTALATREDRWSQFSDVSFRTPPRLPGSSPKTDIGSFEIVDNNVNRDVYLYWQAIPKYLENGGNFNYEIDHVEESGRKLSLVPNEITKTYAKFKGISFNSYRFEIVSANFVGISKQRATIFVPDRYEMPQEPIAFTKIAFDGGLYELSWKLPVTNTEITNYTIFWCDNERDRPYQCTGYLDWVHVPKNTTVHNIIMPNPEMVYQFAISANTEKGSSGMVWASCTVIHDKIVGKMKSVWINSVGSAFIEVGWKLDCSDRIGMVEGFNIYYCPVVSPYNLNCVGPKLNTTIRAGPDTIHGTVNNLKPYTMYMLAVAVLTKSGEGLHSDPLYDTTLEAAPTTPPQDVKVFNVTNSTMYVTWKPPVAMNGVLRYYEVYYNERARKVKEASHVELEELLAHTNYSIGVAACTVSCSAKSPVIRKLTMIGTPGRIDAPNVRFMNSSRVIVVWSKPSYPAGLLNYYEISSSDGEIRNSTETEAQLPIPDCKTVGSERLYQFRVRAVNIASNNAHLGGPWSDPGEGNCYSDGPSIDVWILICVMGGVFIVALLFYLAHVSKRMWLKCKAMQDVEVKLPPGLAQNMKNLQRVGEQRMRQSSADSSGRFTGQESFNSSVTSNSQVLSDSGIEIDPMAGLPNKLLESQLPVWESSSLRQRNVGISRPGFTTETARWEPYVKVAKTREPIVKDTLSLARSTPNLTDSTGYAISQHPWSSIDYISMPLSEKSSSNSNAVPKKTAVAGGNSVICKVSKSINSKSEDNSSLTKSTVLPTKSEEKHAKPYVTLDSLKQRNEETVDSSHGSDELTFPEFNKSKLASSSPFNVSEKTSKSYVRIDLTDSLKKFTLSNIDDTTSATASTSFAATSLTDSHDKAFVSSFASPTTLASTQASASKPYVALSSISNVTKKSDSSQKNATPQSSIAISKVETLRPCQFRVSNAATTAKREAANGQTSDTQPSSKLNADNSVVMAKRSTGYVAIAENPKLDQRRKSTTSSPYVQRDRFEKPLPQTAKEQTNDQYIKVTVVPSTGQ